MPAPARRARCRAAPGGARDRAAAAPRRSRALGLFIRAHALVAQGKPDEAVHEASGILDATGALSSYVIVRQFTDLGRALASYKSCAVVGDFLARLEPALRDRVAAHRSFPSSALVGLR